MLWSMPASRKITITGAREHNLRNVDLVIPRDQLVVVTGVSGSGKSSLAFDTIFAEERKPWNQVPEQFLQQMPNPDIEASRATPYPITKRVATKMTVATTTEIWTPATALRPMQHHLLEEDIKGTCGSQSPAQVPARS